MDSLDTISLPSQAVVLANQNGSRTDMLRVAHYWSRQLLTKPKGCSPRMRETFAQKHSHADFD